LKRGPLANFDVSDLTADQSAIFLATTATIADNGVKLRRLYVWESDTDRYTYVYTESGRVVASYPPPGGYDPYILSRERIEEETNLTQDRREWLIKSLDPSRVILCVPVADGPIPIAPPILQPDPSAKATFPGGFGTLGFDPEDPEPGSHTVPTWSDEPPLGLKLTFQNPGLDTRIPIWLCDGPDFDPSSYAWEAMVESAPSDEASWTDEDAPDYGSRHYYTPFLDTTYVQSPSSDSLTVKYVAARNVTATAYLWEPGEWAEAASEGASKVSLGSGVYVYEATFNDLDADTIYRYTFTWAGGDEHTAVQTARTWPEQEDIGDFSFIVYGDNRYQNSDPTFNTYHRDVACLGILRGGCMSESEYPDFILHVGDFVYDGGHADEWIPHFFRPAGAVISRTPVFPCVGNHEDDPASNYVELFNVPENAYKAEHKERYYWFNYGDCYFVVLDTNLPFGVGSDQYKWLIGDKGQGCLTWTEFLNALAVHRAALPAVHGFERFPTPLERQRRHGRKDDSGADLRELDLPTGPSQGGRGLQRPQPLL